MVEKSIFLDEKNGIIFKIRLNLLIDNMIKE